MLLKITAVVCCCIALLLKLLLLVNLTLLVESKIITFGSVESMYQSIYSVFFQNHLRVLFQAKQPEDRWALFALGTMRTKEQEKSWRAGIRYDPLTDSDKVMQDVFKQLEITFHDHNNVIFNSLSHK
jgi:hypothetical protein